MKLYDDVLILGHIFTIEAQVALDHSQIMLENTNLWSSCNSAAVIEQHNYIFIKYKLLLSVCKTAENEAVYSQKNNNILRSRLKHSIVFIICCINVCIYDMSVFYS